MFRNPRVNANRDSSLHLLPDVGRPPSPPAPSTSDTSSFTTRPIPSMSRSQTLAETAVKTPSRPGPRQLSSSSIKARPKGNSSILSFFKKQDPNSTDPAVVESLFVEDRNSWRSGNAATATGLIVGLNADHDSAAREHEDDDDMRFNENETSNKRRKTSPSLMGDVDRDTIQPACTPPPRDFDDERNPANPIEAPTKASTIPETCARRGPFLSDSDSEDGDDTSGTCAPAPSNLGTVQVENEPQDEPQGKLDDESRDELPDSATVVEDEMTEDIEPDQSEFQDFEGDNDDIDDDYEEGEEYVERKWMEEQIRLEAEAASELRIKTEDGHDQIMIPATAGSCPICEVSFAGATDQEASVHVNHCLDGNPTPLPSEARMKEEHAQEPKKEKKQYERPVRAPKPGQQNPFELGSSKGTSSAFSKMMTGNAEDIAWATAAAAENASRGKPAYTRTCPFYKILPGLFICVDAFRYGAVQGCKAYFLSHFHSDHYIGLTATWRNGPIYCSKPTANLVKQQLRVDANFVVALEFEQKVEVPGTKGVFVTMIPANHCPGSSLFLFEKQLGSGPKSKTQRILHCGDFRACPAHIEHPLLKPEVQDAITGKTSQQRIDVCYLDTTYLNPKYAFPSQEDVIKACADMCVSLSKSQVEDDAWEQAKRERAGGTMANFVRKDSTGLDVSIAVAEGSNSKSRGGLLVVVGTYSIGKERICLGIAKALNSKIYAPPNKQRICAALEDSELNSRLTKDPLEAQVHMTPLFEIRADTLEEYMAEYKDRFSRAVAFRPSGWSYRPPGSRFTDSPSVSTVLHNENWKSFYSMKDLVPQRGSTSKINTFGVPYSEHSSFRELTMFCCALRIDKIIPTVNIGSAKSRERMKLWCERWALERKKNGLFQAGPKEDGYPAWFPGRGTLELRTNL